MHKINNIESTCRHTKLYSSQHHKRTDGPWALQHQPGLILQTPKTQYQDLKLHHLKWDNSIHNVRLMICIAQCYNSQPIWPYMYHSSQTVLHVSLNTVTASQMILHNNWGGQLSIVRTTYPISRLGLLEAAEVGEMMQQYSQLLKPFNSRQWDIIVILEVRCFYQMFQRMLI